MTPPYEVRVSSPAHRQLSRLPSRVTPAVVEFITAVLAENPVRLSEPLTGELEGLRSARRGDYRVLIEVDESARTVLVLRIAHRAEAYRPPPPSTD
ncbi:type II toxin-antitoxin system RelE family toxin [Modestobacter marinus]|uniref:type II toxin-antitoxin system RelE family toxin n=1 Tax=Modestobacter marinus TaxID=477641 RepID=UPI001C93BE49|nr:type II toxin-antitoxin system RelE/ParE family toxin [Modestobacter marinus]